MRSVVSNTTLDVQQLPRMEEAPLVPVSRRLAPCLLLQRLLRWLLLIAFVLWVPIDTELSAWQPWAAAAIAVVGLTMLMLGFCEARRRAYALREHDLIYRRGLLVRRTQVLPLVRLQHVETLSNPLERLFGLVRLSCYTAGGRGADLLMEGVSRQEAEAVKSYLLSRLEAAPRS
ncbi:MULTISPECIES: PH domain-containing protein [Halomonadaceae]|uniref:PH domain-containing protein n=1 Tax=Halomonadaceae TaxID=28256 RepID=UPI00159AE99F|nr:MULTISPECIES: PH domain-containing protein [Halomonas]QJQ94681.1 PH domain-containing protein [Halomonas sp. PA5]